MYDVLDDHHSCNRQPHAPDAQHIWKQAVKQIGSESEDSNDSNESTIQPVAKCAKWHSKTPYKSSAGNPTQLKFYNGTWVDIPKLVKRYFCLKITMETNFPEHEQHLHLATNCLTHAIEEHHQVVLPQSMTDIFGNLK